MLPIEQPRAVARQLDAVLSAQRFGATLLGIFSGLALLIAAIGIYGVAAWTVATERREIGIRMALGARARRVLARVLGRTASATAAGAALGLAAAAVLARLVETFLDQVEPLDPGAFTAALLALGAAAALAAWLPALRAVRVDPAETMRSE
jgi:ABC-type antimicrobial peptide transport system permease subunit